jgi:hypothetical protein
MGERNLGPILSNYLHITQPFDTHNRNEMKVNLSVSTAQEGTSSANRRKLQPASGTSYGSETA